MSLAHELAALSTEFLLAVKRDEGTDTYRSQLADLSHDRLTALDEDDRAARAFWINCYNAFVQVHLKDDPSLYDDRRRFFGAARITIAGTALSLDDIEHGLLRASKWKYGLGYVPRLRPSTFERTHRLSAVDPRIHFALNCAAESCPPIAAYTASDLDTELDTSAGSFLRASSTHDRNAGVVWVTRLFLYYRGDFGGRRGIYAFLERHGVIEADERPRVRYEPYDWTRQVGLYRE